MKKSFLLRIDEETFDKVKDVSEVEERSINYMLCKLISKGLNRINLDESIEKDIEDFANKKKITKSELIESIWKAYKKTYK